MRKSFVMSFLLTILIACSSSAPISTTTIPTLEAKVPTLTSPPSVSATSTMPHEAILTLASPNGEFIAKQYDIGYSSLDEQVIEISNKDGLVLWQIQYKEGQFGDHKVSLSIYGWTNDSSALYFYYHQFTDGGGWAFWWNGSDLQAIDITTGDIRHILPGEGLMSFDMSPDGKEVAYTRAQDKPGVLFIRDLIQNNDTTIFVQPKQEYKRVGDIHWSPSGTALLFQTEAEPEENRVQVQAIYLDTATLEQKVVKQYDLESIWFEDWQDEHTLRFHGLDDSILLIDVFTNETIIIGTATPPP